jgi:hypothetical protein
MAGQSDCRRFERSASGRYYIKKRNVHSRGLDRCDWIFNLEGAELSVLRGARKVLSGSMRPCLIIEFWGQFQREYGSSCAEMASFLIAHGYTLFWITETGLVPYAHRNEEQSGVAAFNVLATPAGLVY